MKYYLNLKNYFGFTTSCLKQIYQPYLISQLLVQEKESKHSKIYLTTSHKFWIIGKSFFAKCKAVLQVQLEKKTSLNYVNLWTAFIKPQCPQTTCVSCWWFLHNCFWRVLNEVLDNLLQTGECYPKVWNSSCEVWFR